MSGWSLVLCEGFDDRAFWKAWLVRLGCTDARDLKSDVYGRKPTAGGSFRFRTPSGRHVEVRPAHGVAKLGKHVSDTLKDVLHPADVLVVNLDDDLGAEAPTGARGHQVIANMVGGGALGADGAWEVGSTRIVPAVWCCDDAATPGVPAKQTLERLVCAAMVEAHPARAAPVEALSAAPAGPISHKSYRFAWLAKWYADAGPDHFFAELWSDDAVRSALEKRLGNVAPHVRDLAS